jgi:hypothetical protein
MKITNNNIFEINEFIVEIGTLERTQDLIHHLLVNKQSLQLLWPVFAQRLLQEWTRLLFYNRIILSSGPLEKNPRNDTLYLHLDEKSQLSVYKNENNKIISQEEKKGLTKIIGENKLAPFFNFEKPFFEIDKAEEIKQVMLILNLTPFLSFIAFTLLNKYKLAQIPLLLKNKNEVTHEILKLSFDKKLFALIYFLTIKGVVINNSVTRLESYESYEVISAHAHHGEIIGEKYGWKTIYHSIKVLSTDYLFKNSKLDLEMIHSIIEQGADFPFHHWEKIIDQSLTRIEEEKGQVSDSSIELNLLIRAYRLEKISFRQGLQRILKLRSKIDHLFIIAVEAFYLSIELECLKSPWHDLFADKRDLPIINLALKSLKPLIKKVTTLDGERLQQMKVNLFFHAKKPPEKPGKLYVLLNELKSSGLISIISAAPLEQKDKPQNSAQPK